jgi:hypothetical protein
MDRTANPKSDLNLTSTRYNNFPHRGRTCGQWCFNCSTTSTGRLRGGRRRSRRWQTRLPMPCHAHVLGGGHTACYRGRSGEFSYSITLTIGMRRRRWRCPYRWAKLTHSRPNGGGVRRGQWGRCVAHMVRGGGCDPWRSHNNHIHKHNRVGGGAHGVFEGRSGEFLYNSCMYRCHVLPKLVWSSLSRTQP